MVARDFVHFGPRSVFELDTPGLKLNFIHPYYVIFTEIGYIINNHI